MEDLEIVFLIMDKEEEGLRLLLEHHGAKVHSYLKKHYKNVLSELEINEALYEAIDKIWCKIDSYDEKKGKLGAWFLRIAQHCAINIIRRESKFKAEELDKNSMTINGILLEKTKTESKKITKLKKELKNAINELPAMQKSIMESDLAAEGGQASAVRLAEMHGTTANSIRVSRNKAKKNLEKKLSDKLSNFKKGK